MWDNKGSRDTEPTHKYQHQYTDDNDYKPDEGVQNWVNPSKMTVPPKTKMNKKVIF